MQILKVKGKLMNHQGNLGIFVGTLIGKLE